MTECRTVAGLGRGEEVVTVLFADRFRLFWTPFLKKQRGRMMQALGLVFPPVLGSGGELTLHVGRQKLTARKMDLISYPIPSQSQEDAHVYLWMIPRPSRVTTCRAVWRPPLGGTFRDSLRLKPADPLNIHVAFKTHLDIGYTATPEEVIRLYQTDLLQRLLDNLDATAGYKPHHRFVWTMPTWLVEQCLDTRAVGAERVRRLEHYIRVGQVVWGLAPFNTHSEFFGLEEMCRSLYAARRLAEKYGRPVPTAAKMTDVPAHTASLAMAFAAAGGRFFQIGTNPDSLPPKVPPLFWWVLPDTNRLLCHYHGTYGTPLLPPPEWPWREWLSLQVTNDNVGPQSLDLLRHLAWIEDRFDYPLCRTGRMEDFADAVIRRHGKDLPLFEDELADWWIHGIGSMARCTAMARRDKDRLPSVEALHTMSGWLSGKPVADDVREDIRKAYERLALYTEHTWGDHVADARKALPKGNRYTSKVFAGDKTPPPVDRWVHAWDFKARFATDAHRAIDRIHDRAVSSFAARMGRGAGRAGIVVFNTLSWPRGGLVRLQTTGLPRGDFELIDPTTGGVVLYERTEDGVEFVAPTVPACGYLALQIHPVSARSRPGLPAEWDARGLSLHLGGYSLQFHTMGGIARWHDRTHSQQWCSSEAEWPLGSYLYEMPGGEKLHRFAYAAHTNCWENTPGYFDRYDYEDMPQFGPAPAGPARVRAEITPLFARVTLDGDCPARRVPRRRSGDARRYRTTFTLYNGRPELYVRTQLFAKQPTFAAEVGYTFFPFVGDEPFILIDRIAHLIEPTEDLAERVNRAVMAVHHGIRIELEHAGMNFYPLDTPLVGFGEPNAYRFDTEAKFDNGVLYPNLFNNTWGTNFAQWQSGDFSYEFVCRPTRNDDWDGGLAAGGAEYFRPLTAAVVPGLKGQPAGSLLSVTPHSVQLVALKPADFAPGTVIRLWNADVDPATARLKLPAFRPGQTLWQCDLLERPQGRPIPLSRAGEASIRLKPQAIATLLLTSPRTGGLQRPKTRRASD